MKIFQFFLRKKLVSMKYTVVVNENNQVCLQLRVAVRLKGKTEKRDVPLTVYFTEGAAEEVALALVEAAESIRLIREAHEIEEVDPFDTKILMATD